MRLLLLQLWRRDADSVAIVRDKSMRLDVVAVRRDEFAGARGKSIGALFAQSKHPYPPSAVAKHERAKVSVYRDDGAAFGDRECEDGAIAWIGAACTDAGNIVTICDQPACDGASDAAIEQELPLLHWPPQPPRRTSGSCQKACLHRAAPP